MIEDILSIIFALLGIVGVVILTYYASKFYAKKLGPIAGGKHIRVIDRVMVSKTGSILIIDVEGKQYMIGVNEQSIQIMKELDSPIQIQKPEEAAHFASIKDFKSLFQRGKNNE